MSKCCETLPGLLCCDFYLFSSSDFCLLAQLGLIFSKIPPHRVWLCLQVITAEYSLYMKASSKILGTAALCWPKRGTRVFKWRCWKLNEILPFKNETKHLYMTEWQQKIWIKILLLYSVLLFSFCKLLLNYLNPKPLCGAWWWWESCFLSERPDFFFNYFRRRTLSNKSFKQTKVDDDRQRRQ